MKSNLEKLNEMTTPPEKNWLDSAQDRQKNQELLKKSQAEALSILRFIREKDISKQTLSELSQIPQDKIDAILGGTLEYSSEDLTHLKTYLGIA